jgi:putative transposase
MTALDERITVLELIEQAVSAGARRAKACALLGLSLRTVQRWCRGGVVHSDARRDAIRPEPANKLSESERLAALALCHRPEYASLAPTQIVPREADQGRYVACESTLYRILREHDELNHRGRAKAPGRQGEPRTHCATAPNQVWCWDITWLAGPARGLFYYLYMVIDLYSRKIVGWEVYEREGADHASVLMRRAVLSEQCIALPQVLHSDNGSVQKASTLMATLDALGVEPSYLRPRVSNDNAFAESLFRTCKYRPDYPVGGFATIDEAREWVARFVQWYHDEHRHRSLRYITPAQRHAGLDEEILAKRHQLYQQAKAEHPERWTGPTRCWEPIAEVWLNQRTGAKPIPQKRSKAA